MEFVHIEDDNMRDGIIILEDPMLVSVFESFDNSLINYLLRVLGCSNILITSRGNYGSFLP